MQGSIPIPADEMGDSERGAEDGGNQDDSARSSGQGSKGKSLSTKSAVPSLPLLPLPNTPPLTATKEVAGGEKTRVRLGASAVRSAAPAPAAPAPACDAAHQGADAELHELGGPTDAAGGRGA